MAQIKFATFTLATLNLTHAHPLPPSLCALHSLATMATTPYINVGHNLHMEIRSPQTLRHKKSRRHPIMNHLRQLLPQHLPPTQTKRLPLCRKLGKLTRRLMQTTDPQSRPQPQHRHLLCPPQVATMNVWLKCLGQGDGSSLKAKEDRAEPRRICYG